jgi:uncharacterized phage protein (TIGR02218 family)
MRDINSAFYARLQTNDQLAEVIDLTTANGQSFHWTTANQAIQSVASSDLVTYNPFPGHTPGGIEESSDLGVSIVDFVVANTGDVFRALMTGGNFSEASLRISRLFPSTPGLGRMVIYDGKIGDYSYNRQAVRGQARNRWQGIAAQFPHYTYQDTCVWRFGGPGCGFNTTSITLSIASGFISADSSDTLTLFFANGTLSNSYANGRFDFGRLTVTGGVNSGEVRTIRVHTGDAVSLSHPLSINSLAGMSVSIFPGCRKRRIDDCTSLYNNIENFMGFPWIPIQETAII